MSSILKALRKVEEEKAARRDGEITDIAREIVRPTRRRRGTIWREPAIVTGTMLLLAFGGFSLLPWDGGPSAGFREHQVSITAPSAQASGVGFASPPREQIIEQSIPVDVPRSFPAAPPIEARETATMSSPHPAPASIAAPEPVAPAGEAQSTPAVAVAATTSAETVIAQPDPAVSVESIIFHPQPEARMAVINGLPVMHGTIIDGTRIEEILADRVRLSREGKLFENRVNSKGVTSNE